MFQETEAQGLHSLGFFMRSRAACGLARLVPHQPCRDIERQILE
jgi:hypothetical protein